MEPQLGVTESNLFSSAKERQGSGAGRGCAIVSAAFQRLKYRLVLVRACPILRDAHELELIPPKKRLNNCCLGLFEGGRGFDRGKINSETPSMNFAANVPLWNRFSLFFILFYFLPHLRSNVKIPGGRMNGYDYS